MKLITANKMHHAWHIDDIRYLIFELLERGDLARLARTCKALSDFAVNELWRKPNSIACFLSCLPQGYRNRPLQSQDLERLDFYASKAQKLVLESDDVRYPIRLPYEFLAVKKSMNNPCKSWKELWAEIAALRPQSNFMPNLRSIRVSNISEELLLPLIGISGARLTKIYVKYIHDRHKPSSLVFDFLNQLQDFSRLEYLFVRDGEPDLVPTRLIQQAPLKHLRLDPRIHARRHQDYQFKSYPLRPEILQKSTLEQLTLGLTREWYSPEIEALDTRYLPALRTLWLNLTTFKPDPHSRDLDARCWVRGSEIQKRSPVVFFEGLDNPDLDLLNIKFPAEASGSMFLEVVSAAKENCRMENLTELALAGGGWFNNCGECGKRFAPNVQPAELRQAMKILLPLPQLTTLRISVAPNFLDVLDLEMYQSMADGLPNLERLWLGHPEFWACSYFEGTTYYERMPLHHLAAFCSMLPSLLEVSLGCADGQVLEEHPRIEWQCPQVKTLSISWWAKGVYGEPLVSRDLLHLGLKTYFPNSDLAQTEYSSQCYFFT